MKRTQVAALSGMIVLLAAQTWAAQVSSTQVDRKLSERQMARAEMNGGAERPYRSDQRRVNRLNDDLESGRSVSPASIDRALRRSGDRNR